MNFFSLFKRNLIFKLKKKINIDPDEFENNVGFEKLFSFYKTDKAKFIESDNLNGHGFSEFYEKHFSRLRTEKLKILEIGSFSGASAAAFSKYFQNSKIYCLDINLTKFIYRSNRIFPYGVDITNFKTVNKFLEDIEFKKSISFFDIIIDDGSHLLSHQLKSLNYFFKLVKKGGFYIVEDYKFPEYFKHLKDVPENTIGEIIKNLKKEKNFNSNLLENEIYNLLKKNNSNIFEYKGKKDISDILFIEKLY